VSSEEPKHRRRRPRRKSRETWLGYYCKVVGFESHGGANGPSLVLDLELQEPVPKVTSVELTVYCERAAPRIWEDGILDDATGPKIGALLQGRSLASRRPDGSVHIVTWWHPIAVVALLSVLLSRHHLYIHFNATQFYRNHAEVGAIDWYTEGAWRADVVGEDCDLS
jgi:hypothetical protein